MRDLFDMSMISLFYIDNLTVVRYNLPNNC